MIEHLLPRIEGKKIVVDVEGNRMFQRSCCVDYYFSIVFRSDSNRFVITWWELLKLWRAKDRRDATSVELQEDITSLALDPVLITNRKRFLSHQKTTKKNQRASETPLSPVSPGGVDGLLWKSQFLLFIIWTKPFDRIWIATQDREGIFPFLRPPRFSSS